MLGGIDPLLIFTISPDDPNALKKSLSGIPDSITGFLAATGIPIPIYLNEKLTGIWLDSGEDKDLNFDTQPQQAVDGKSKIQQRGIQSDVSINLAAKNDSLILTALLALAEQCFEKAVSKKYSVSYFNGPTTIIGGLISGFKVSSIPNSEKLMIAITLTKKHADTEISPVPTLTKVTGPTPLVGGN